MGKLRKSLIFILGIMMLLSGCGKNGEKNSGTEMQMVQEIIDIPKEIINFCDVIEGKDGEILAVGNCEENQSVWTYNQEQKKWQEEYSITELLKKAGASVEVGETLAYISEAGELFCCVNEWEEKTGELISTENYYIKEGNVEKIFIDSIDAIYQAVFTDSDNVILQDVSGNLYQYSKEKQIITKTYLESSEYGFPETFFVSNNCLYVLISDELYVFDVNTGMNLEKETDDKFFLSNFDLDLEMEGVLLTKIIKKDNVFFCFNKEGIVKYSELGKESLINGTSTCASYQGAVLEDFFISEDGSFFANFYTMQGTKFCHYFYQEVDEVKQAETITLYTLYETDEWNQLIAFYKEENPEVRIELEVGIEEGAATTESEALRKLNMELVNEEGPDIICFDGFSAENYKAYLLDISGIVQQEEGCCYENILRAYETKDGIYQLPMRFACVGVIGKEETIGEFSNTRVLLSDLDLEFEKINENYFTNIITIMCRLYLAENTEFLEASSISVEDFYNCLEQIRNKCGDEALKKSWFSWDEIGTRNIDLNEIFPDNIENSDLSLCYITNAQGWQRMMAAERDYGVVFREFTNGDTFYFAAQNVLGINKNSNSQQAEHFLEFALSERGQQAFSSFSLSVNQNVLREEFEHANGVEAWGYTDENGNRAEWKMENLTEEQIARFEQLVKNLELPISNQCLLVEMIREPYVQFLEGEITLEAAIDNASSKKEIYQMEN